MSIYMDLPFCSLSCAIVFALRKVRSCLQERISFIQESITAICNKLNHVIYMGTGRVEVNLHRTNRDPCDPCSDPAEFSA